MEEGGDREGEGRGVCASEVVRHPAHASPRLVLVLLRFNRIITKASQMAEHLQMTANKQLT